MSYPVHPKIIAPRGIIEGTHYVPHGGFALKAVDSLGVCLRFAIVHTRSEYAEAMRTLGQFLDERDPALAAFDFNRACADAFSRSPFAEHAGLSDAALHLVR